MFLPLTASMNETWGWRIAVGALAAIVGASTWLTSTVALRHVSPVSAAAEAPSPVASGSIRTRVPARARGVLGDQPRERGVHDHARAGICRPCLYTDNRRHARWRSRTDATSGQGLVDERNGGGVASDPAGRESRSPGGWPCGALRLDVVAARGCRGRAICGRCGTDDAHPAAFRAERVRDCARRPYERRGGALAAAGAGGSSSADGWARERHRLRNGVRAAGGDLRRRWP